MVTQASMHWQISHPDRRLITSQVPGWFYASSQQIWCGRLYAVHRRSSRYLGQSGHNECLDLYMQKSYNTTGDFDDHFYDPGTLIRQLNESLPTLPWSFRSSPRDFSYHPCLNLSTRAWPTFPLVYSLHSFPSRSTSMWARIRAKRHLERNGTSPLRRALNDVDEPVEVADGILDQDRWGR